MKPQHIAVIGGGVSGMVAAHYLSRHHRVELIEARNRLGGHANTVSIDGKFGADADMPVDTGFIVYNDRTYPFFILFLQELGIQGAATEMSFSYCDLERRLAYAGTNLAGVFARSRQLLDPRFWWFLGHILRFNRRARSDLAAGVLDDLTLAEYLERLQASPRLRRDYLGPMTQAIWSAPEADALDAPAASFIRFFENHGLLDPAQMPQWRYIKGGSTAYVQAFADQFPGRIRLGLPVRSVQRDTGTAPLIRYDGGEARYDAVVIAVHADQALALLEDADDIEQAALGKWRYSRNRAVLHCDPAHMPPYKRAWACWNVLRQPATTARQPVQVTYWMNRLQRFSAHAPWLLSLNPSPDVAAEKVAYATEYAHPVYTKASTASQELLPGVSGRRETYFCGSYHGYGFHEDGARSGALVARNYFGIDL